MLLDSLKDFSWYNEPENVRFIEEGMLIETAPETDFWANIPHRFHKDDGHFFYTLVRGDFSLTVCCSGEISTPFAQCGIMARIDSRNWVKASLLTANRNQPKIGSVVTNGGLSDWASLPLLALPDKIWFRLKRKAGDLILFYSIDGENFEQLRLFRLAAEQDELKVGAYTANPDKGKYVALLESVTLQRS